MCAPVLPAAPTTAFVRGPVFYPAPAVVAAWTPDATAATARVGDTVQVLFRTCTSYCGYRWVISAGADARVARYVSTRYRYFGGQDDIETVTFRAVSAATTTVTWGYRRGSEPPVRRFTFTIRVAALTTFTAQEVKWAPSAPPGRPVQFLRVRVGNDGAFDRVVFDVRGALPGYRAEIQPWIRDVSQPNGYYAPRGLFFLQVTLEDTRPWGGTPSLLATGLPEIRQVRYAGYRSAVPGFAQVTSYGLVLQTLRPFRVFRLSGPDRLVVDVLH